MNNTELIARQRQAVVNMKLSPNQSLRRNIGDLYKAVKGKEGLPGPIRVAMMCRSRIERIEFELDSNEEMVGRVSVVQQETEAERQEALEYAKTHPWGFKTCGQNGHAQLDYSKLLIHGVPGLRKKIAASKKSTFRESCLIAFDAFVEMIRKAENAARKAGNTRVEKSCHRILTQPPETFRDALQTIWFTILATEVGDRASLFVPGRLDKLLIPFWNREKSHGSLTHQEAVELIAQFYLYINLYCESGLAYSVMVGGDTVNEVSYMCLEALRISRMSYPSVGVCVNDATPQDLKMLAIDIISEGLPMPAFFNDKCIREGLIRYGIPVAEAGNYINSTCVEITPATCSNVYVASPYFNLSEILLETMGKSNPKDWDGFMKDYYSCLDFQIKMAAKNNVDTRRLRRQYMRRPLQSIFTNDCLERGKDIEAGGARYNWCECSFVGLANLVDSLYVIRQEVFEKKNLTLKQLKSLCDSDFKDAEQLRLKFLNEYPKYGIADARVDSMIPPIIAHIEKECAKYSMGTAEDHFIPGTFCWIMHQLLGAETCATPDGRRACFPFADGAGPAQGREKTGPTNAISSVCSWNHSGLIGGSAFNMKYPKSLLQTPEMRKKLLDLVDVFIKNGGFETQINVTDADALERAMKEPEKYTDLIVRIGGYTDYFVRLPIGMQKELLLRTKYASLG